MNAYGIKEKYKGIKESLRHTDFRIEGLIKKKEKLVRAKEYYGLKIRELKKEPKKKREFKKKRKE